MSDNHKGSFLHTQNWEGELKTPSQFEPYIGKKIWAVRIATKYTGNHRKTQVEMQDYMLINNQHGTRRSGEFHYLACSITKNEAQIYFNLIFNGEEISASTYLKLFDNKDKAEKYALILKLMQ